ncbi:MAG: hypothetical protein J6Y53_02845 [Alphaproteobacteria bacterium]|nr:hypothetical protein [Alphaproteobacteria bacterium]
MNTKDLEYLRKMEKESTKRDFSEEEIRKIDEALRTNVSGNDTTEALDLSASIAETQVEKYGTDVDSLLDTILYHGELLGAKNATDKATEAKFSLAAKFIDSEQYDKFENMSFEYISKEIFEYYVPYPILKKSKDVDQTPYIIADKVKTMQGIQYMVGHNKINNDYFTDDSRHSIENASLEQLEFYVSKGANINAVIDYWEYGDEERQDRSVLDKYLMDTNGDSIEYMKKIIELGGKKLDNDLIGEICHYYCYEQCGGPKLFLDKIALLRNNSMLDASEERSVKKAMAAETDYLEWKIQDMRRELGNKVGKTADVETGKVTEEHRQTAKEQANISKAIMKAKRAKEGK